MIIRLAEAEDLPGIVGIYNASIPARASTADLKPVSVESRVPWFNGFGAGKRPLWVADDNGKLAGWLSLGYFKERAGYRHTAEVGIYLDEKYFGTGLANKLLIYSLEQAPLWHIRTILAVIFAHNTRSIRFFQNHRFEKWGHLPLVTDMAGVERDVVIYGLRLRS